MMNRKYIINFFSENKNICLQAITLFLLGFFFYELNTNVPYRSDDYYYKYKFLKTNVYNLPQPIDPTKPVNSFSDIIESQINHYQSMNGRFVVQSLVQLFCSKNNKTIYNIIASFIFAFYLLVIGKIILRSKSSSFIYWIIAITAFWFAIPYPAALTSSVSFGVNYLFVSFICLLFLYLYRTINSNTKCYIYPILFIFSLICGSLHEGFTLGISGFLFINLIFNWKKLSQQKKIMAFGFLLGSIFLIVSPGNIDRASQDNPNTDLINIINNRILLFEKLRRFWAVIFVIVFLFLKNKKLLKTLYSNNKDLIYIIFFQFIFLVLLGFRNERSLYGIELFSLVLFLIVLIHLLSQKKQLSKYISFLSVFLLITSSFGIIKDAKLINQEYTCIINEYLKSPTGEAHFQKLELNKFCSRYVNRFDSPQWEFDAISFKYKKKLIITKGI